MYPYSHNHKRGFSFDVGATTFVDFGDNGVGGELLKDLDIPRPLQDSEVLPGYKLHLPDGEVRQHDQFEKQFFLCFFPGDPPVQRSYSI